MSTSTGARPGQMVSMKAHDMTWNEASAIFCKEYLARKGMHPTMGSEPCKIHRQGRCPVVSRDSDADR
jgi:hypothetical protein